MPTPAKGYPSSARRLHFIDTVTLDASLGMMLFDRFTVRGVQHAIDLVVLLAEQDVVVRDPELVRGMNFGIVVVASSGLDDGSLSRASQQRSAQEIKTVRFKVPRRVAPS
jgi:hypothetical protein